MEKRGMIASDIINIVLALLISNSYCSEKSSVVEIVTRECGFGQSSNGELAAFKNQKIIQECKNWTDIWSLSAKHISDENADEILCALYFESLISLCKNAQLPLPKKQEIALNQLKIDIPGDVCKDLMVLPRNSSHMKDIIKTEQMCNHFCYGMENGEFILKELCLKAYYFNSLDNGTSVLSSSLKNQKQIRKPTFDDQNKSVPILTKTDNSNDSTKNYPPKSGTIQNTGDIGVILSVLEKGLGVSKAAPVGQIEISNLKANVEPPPIDVNVNVQPSIDRRLSDKKHNPENVEQNLAAHLTSNSKKSYQPQDKVEGSEVKISKEKLTTLTDTSQLKPNNEGFTTNPEPNNDPDMNEDISLGEVQGGNMDDFNNQESPPSKVKMDLPNIEDENKIENNINLDDAKLKNLPEVQETFPVDEADSLQGNSLKENSLSLSDIYKLDADMDGNSNFFAYFSFICVIFVIGYVGYHNKQKVLALLLEGRHSRRPQRGRRPNSANYHKLDTNLEEAISSSCRKNSNLIIY